MSARPQRGTALLVIGGVCLALVVWVVSGIVLTGTDRAVLAVSRFGDGVRLVHGGVGWIPRGLAQRVEVASSAGHVRVEVPVVATAADGQPVNLVVALGFEGAGRLPLAANVVRDRGWAAAWTDVIEPAVAEAAGARTGVEWARGDELWHQIFADAGEAVVVDLRAELAPVVAAGGVRLVTADARPGLAPERVRELAAERIHAGDEGVARVVIVGLDGADWTFLDPLLARGKMPNLGRFLRRGARGVLDAPQPVISPPIWTSIATGVTPDVHGVLDFLTTDPATGEVRPVASYDRKVPALWSMLSALDIGVGVVGWWATWPAEPVTGFMVTDRVTDVLMPLDEELEGVIEPPELRAELDRLRVEAAQVDVDTGRLMLDVSRIEWNEALAHQGYEDPIGALRRILASTLTVDRCTRGLASERQPRVVMTYFQGTDTVGHVFAPYAPPRRADVTDEDFRRFGGVGEAYFDWLDGMLGAYLGQADDNTTVIVVSDHGFHWREERPHAPAEPETPTAVWWHRDEGVFVAAGRGIRAGAEGRVRPEDVVPTVLTLLGLPAGVGLGGHPAGWCLTAAVTARAVGAGEIDYGALVGDTRQAAVALPAAAKAALEDKLRALGYLADSPAPEPTVDDPRRGMVDARRLNNLGSSLLEAGREADAEQAYRDAIAAAPDYAAPRYNLMLLLFKRGDYDAAEEMFWSAVERNLRERERAVVDLALAYLEKGEAERAIKVLEEGRRRFPSSYVVHVNAGTVLAQHGRLAQAADAYRRAIDIDPRSTVARNNLALILIQGGAGVPRDLEEGRRQLAASLEIDPEQPQVRQLLQTIAE